MTNVIATAMIEMIAVWRKTFSRFVGVRKPFSPSVNAKTTKTMRKPM